MSDDATTMAALLLKRDGQHTEQGQELTDMIGQVVDVDLFLEVASKRAISVLQNGIPPTAVAPEFHQEILYAVATAFADGFMLGYEFRQEKEADTEAH